MSNGFETFMRQQTAQLNYLHIAPRKVRLIANTLTGMPVRDAEAQLLLRSQRSAKPLLKLLRSAVANAKQNQQISVEKLVVRRVIVDQGPMLKRGLPRAQGRMTPIQKKMSHVTLFLEEAAQGRESRFTIIPPPKKEKKEQKEAKPRAERVKKPEISSSEKPKEKGGFFKRIFQRKSV